MADLELMAMQKRIAGAARRLDRGTSLVFQNAARYVSDTCCIVAVDPGASTGWCVVESGLQSRPSEWWSGQDPGRTAARHITDIVLGNPIGLLVIEEPFFVGTGNQWKLAWSGGEMFGRLADSLVDEAAAWRVKPVSWRSVLGLNVKGGRQIVNDACHTHAESTLGKPLRTSSGALEYDRASAVCMALAACALLEQLSATAASAANNKGSP